MPNTSRSSKKVPSAKEFNPARKVAESLTPTYLKGVQRVADLQKKTLDVAAGLLQRTDHHLHGLCRTRIDDTGEVVDRPRQFRNVLT